MIAVDPLPPWVSIRRNSENGCFRRTFSVYSSTVSTESVNFQTKLVWPPALAEYIGEFLSHIRRMLYSTAWALSRVPSWNCTPCLMWNV